MGLTREEATAILEECRCQNQVMRDNPTTFWTSFQMTEGIANAKKRIAALNLALAALRGPTREMVERMFPGCAYCKLDSEGYVREFGSHYIWDGELKTEYCKPQKIKFCPHCSRPLTDDAVDMMLKRMEEIYK